MTASLAITASPIGPETVTHHNVDDVLVFLRRILYEARSKRHDMITHYTIDDLRVALGFEKPRSDEEVTPRAGKHVSAHPHFRGESQAADGGHGPGSEPTRPRKHPLHMEIPDAPPAYPEIPASP